MLKNAVMKTWSWSKGSWQTVDMGDIPDYPRCKCGEQLGPMDVRLWKLYFCPPCWEDFTSLLP